MKCSTNLVKLMLLTLPMVAFAGPIETSQYPFKPFDDGEILTRVKRVTEDDAPVMSLGEIERRGLMRGKPKTQPWSGPYWELIQGQIANPYQERSFTHFWEFLLWKGNYKEFKTRRRYYLTRVNEMSESELARLAPSEKYDLLLGDQNFDLTNHIWDYVNTWGHGKRWAFVSAIDLPEGFRLPNVSDNISTWEGICHGWAIAAGAYPRPAKAFDMPLPNGKKLKIYPDDVKALVSLMFANSAVQGRVLMEGFRCDETSPLQDEWGRYVDRRTHKPEDEGLPRCADVHPAVWHLSVVNLMGVQGRSFVAELDANNKINNQPMQGYRARYFNPRTGFPGTLKRSIVPLKKYKHDPYASSRSPKAVKLVGIEMLITTSKWTIPKARLKDSPRTDKTNKQRMLYDLELDADGNVVGGQWRVERDLLKYRSDSMGRSRQPDFFWTLPKDYMNDFQAQPLEAWDPGSATPAPVSWQLAAKALHSQILAETHDAGYNSTCTVLNGREVRTIPCEFKTPRPQPLINLVNDLVERAK